MLKIGVIGAGHLGKIHLNLLSNSSHYELIGFYDPNTVAANELSKSTGYPYFSEAAALIEAVDVVDIVSPTPTHFQNAIMALESGKHIFIEKPIASSIEEAKKISAFAKEKNVLGQVGHVERFNPAFKAVQGIIEKPMFIESHRLAEFNPRGTDVSVILDLMIHDIDIILTVVNSPVKSIHASGVAVISDTPDISNARIEFENGCVANLTASRISLKKMRKTRFFQKDAYIAVDFLAKNVEVVKMKDAPEAPDDLAIILQNAEGNKKQIYFQNPQIDSTNAILEELEAFANAITKREEPIVTLIQGTQALEVAQQIIDCF